MRAAALLVLPLVIGCTRKGDAGADVDQSSCNSFKFATVALGDALLSLRAAKEFAKTAPQRSAVAELEIAVLRQIHAESDTVVRGAALMLADGGTKRSQINREREYIESVRIRYPSLPNLEREVASLNQKAFAREIGAVVKLTDPRSPPKCGFGRWRALNEAAIRTAASE